MITDSRVSAREAGGYKVTTSQGTYHVLNAGVMGWGVYAGNNLDLVFTDSGPAIGAADGDELVRALLDADGHGRR